MTIFPVSIEQYQEELRLRDEEIKVLKGKVAIYEQGVPEILQAALNGIRHQTARECAEIVRKYDGLARFAADELEREFGL